MACGLWFADPDLQHRLHCTEAHRNFQPSRARHRGPPIWSHVHSQHSINSWQTGPGWLSGVSSVQVEPTTTFQSDRERPRSRENLSEDPALPPSGERPLVLRATAPASHPPVPQPPPPRGECVLRFLLLIPFPLITAPLFPLGNDPAHTACHLGGALLPGFLLFF